MVSAYSTIPPFTGHAAVLRRQARHVLHRHLAAELRPLRGRKLGVSVHDH